MKKCKITVMRKARYDDLIKKYENEGKIIVLRPSKNLNIARVEKNLAKLKNIHTLGVSDCTLHLDKIKKYLEK